MSCHDRFSSFERKHPRVTPQHHNEFRDNAEFHKYSENLLSIAGDLDRATYGLTGHEDPKMRTRAYKVRMAFSQFMHTICELAGNDYGASAAALDVAINKSHVEKIEASLAPAPASSPAPAPK